MIFPQASSIATVTAGTAYFDYSNSLIYFPLNTFSSPTGHTIEYSYTEFAFELYSGSGSPTNVTIENMIVEKYATPAQHGTVGGTTPPGYGFVVNNVEARFNHGAGIEIGDNGQILNSYSHHNGYMGMESQNVSNFVMANNEMSFNNFAGYSQGFACGGVKNTTAKNGTLSNNYIHDNWGPGIWCDGKCSGMFYQGNIVVNNAADGIIHEIAHSAAMSNNVIIGNGWGLPYEQTLGSAIDLSTSQDVTVQNNFIANNYRGIELSMAPRPQCAAHGYTCSVIDDVMQDNIVVQHNGTAAGLWESVSPFDPSFYTSDSNSFAGNQYCISTTDPSSEFWWITSTTSAGPNTYAQWQAGTPAPYATPGNDTTATFTCPRVFIQNPLSGSDVSGNIPISAFAADAGDTITSITLDVDGTPLTPLVTTTYNFTSVPTASFSGQEAVQVTYDLTSPLSSGNHAIHAVATNGAGQTASSESNIQVTLGPVIPTADYKLAISNSPQTAFPNQTTIFNGTASSVNGYASTVTLSCIAGTTAPSSTCTPLPSTLTPATSTPFTVNASGATGSYNFNVQAVGSDPNHTAHVVPVTLNVVDFALTAPSPSTVTVLRGKASPLVDFQVTAAGSFDQSVTVSCTPAITNATCTLTPGTTVYPTLNSPVNMTASVTAPASTAPGSYAVTIQATTAGAPAALSAAFTLKVTTNPDFILSELSAFPEVNVGSTGANGPISITSQDGFAGTVTLRCPTTYGANSCSISPISVSSFPATATLTINGTSFTAGSYSLSITGTSGFLAHSVNVPFNVGDYSIFGTQSLSLSPGGQGTANLMLTSTYFYSGNINATCDASALSGAQCTLSPANPITVSSGGTASLTASINVPNSATNGTYSIKINTQDTTGAPIHSYTISLTVTQDFAVTSSTLIQTVNPGQTTGAYQLTIQPVGVAFNAAVTLSCPSGLPSGAQCLFNPSTPQTPGTSAVDVIMTISTTASTAAMARTVAFEWPRRYRWLSYAMCLLPSGILLGGRAASGDFRKRKLAMCESIVVLFLSALLVSCAGASSGGGGGGCFSAPSAPTGLTASSTTNTSTILSWTASTADSACTVTGYPVYENGSTTPSATATSTTYSVTGLSPSQPYTFAVAASDSYGTSAPSATLGIYRVTVTGASSGAPANPAHSTQVTLVVTT
jgi:hypothetical protein